MTSTGLSFPGHFLRPFCLLSVISTLCAPSISDGEKSSSNVHLTVYDLKREMKFFLEALGPLYIEYRSLAHDSKLPTERPYNYRVAASDGTGLYYHFSAKFTDDISWTHDPFQQTLRVSHSEITNEWTWDRAFVQTKLMPDQTLPGTANQELLFAALGWWPFPGRPAPRFVGDTPCVFDDIIESTNYNLLKDKVTVSGVSCYVLEYPGHDLLYVNVDRGLKVFFRQLSNPETGMPVQSFFLSNHTEIAPGVWIPKRIRNVIYPDGVSDSLTSSVLDHEHQIIVIKTNQDVDRSIFEFQPRPGSINIDSTNDGWEFSQVRPGGVDHLDDVVESIKLMRQ